MRKVNWFVGIVLLLAVQGVAFAQEHFTEGPVWQVTLARVKPGQMDAYLTSLRQSTKPFLEEEKRQGIILDYKFFFKETQENPQDWDVALAVLYKNHAALDGLAAKGEAIRDKILGGKQPAQQIGEKRKEMREIVAFQLFREVTLK